jgi:hypothetical protein
VIKGAGGKESGLTPQQASGVLRQWYCETPGKTPEGWEDDREVLAWMAEHRGIEERVQAAGRARVAQQVRVCVWGFGGGWYVWRGS